MFYQPTIFDSFPLLVAAESNRHGGVSPTPYQSLNLGKNTDDDPAHVLENRRRFCAGLGFHPDQLALSRQVHGDQVLRVSGPGPVEGFDALVTEAAPWRLGVTASAPPSMTMTAAG